MLNSNVPSCFEPVAREQLKSVVTNRVSQFFTADSFKIEGRDPLVIRFLYAPRRDANCSTRPRFRVETCKFPSESVVP